MPNYRRNRVEGAAYSFTVTLQNRRAATLVNHVGLLRLVVRQVMQLQPFQINAWVVLPDHLHAIWTLPPGDSDF